jgi:hypothetical protein
LAITFGFDGQLPSQTITRFWRRFAYYLYSGPFVLVTIDENSKIFYLHQNGHDSVLCIQKAISSSFYRCYELYVDHDNYIVCYFIFMLCDEVSAKVIARISM